MFEIEKSKVGLITLKYNNKYIHSKYNPLNEAEQFAKGNKDLIKKPIIVLYGLGLGYHITAISKIMNEDSVLYVFEWNYELIDYCKKYNAEVFELSNVKIISSYDEKFYKKLSEKLDLAKDILIHRPSLEIINSSNQTLYNLINDYSLIKQFKSVDDIYDRLGDENFKINTSKNYLKINSFIDKLIENKKKNYVVTAAGPSLDYDLELLKKYRENFNIISVGSSLRALMDHGIKPDGVVITDAKEIVKKQFEGFENENIPLCFAAVASKEAINSYNGPKYIFNYEEDGELYIQTRCTVAVSAIDIAVKCGAKKIVLLGQDLAFINGKSHTETFEKTYGFKDTVKSTNKNKLIKDINGKMVETTQGFITFRNQIQSLIANNKQIQFINCSKGAFIDGAEHMDFMNSINKEGI